MTRDYKKLGKQHRLNSRQNSQRSFKTVTKSTSKKPTTNPLKSLSDAVLKWTKNFQKQNKQAKKEVKEQPKHYKTSAKLKKEPAYKVSVGKRGKKPPRTSFDPGQALLGFVANILKLPIFIFGLLFGGLGKSIGKISRLAILKTVFIGIFAILIFNFIQLQVIARNDLVLQEGSGLVLKVTPSTRGSIFIQDLQAGGKPVEITNSRVMFNVFIQPDNLKSQIESGKITLEQAVVAISGSLNLPYNEVKTALAEEVNSDTPSKYKIIKKFVSKEQKEAVEHLRLYGHGTEKNFAHWLNIDQVEVRSYPEEKFLGSLGATLGYVQREPVAREQALKISNCRSMVRENERRDTVNSHTSKDEDGEYMIGLYGIEQKFCSELGGLNGRQLLGSEVGTKSQEDVEVTHGSDIFLTIDSNIQLRAQEILNQLVEDNTNSQGGPRDGTILVVDVKNNPGAILAMANYPTANPNEYYKDIQGFRNVATSEDYEVGSVMKPLTVAAAINEWQTGQVDKDGKRLGIPTNWQFLGYDNKGKPYEENNGRMLYIRNADGMSYLRIGKLPLANCLRDSINTCIADIQPTIDNLKTKEYFEDRYLAGQPTLVSLPGDQHGNTKPLQENIYSDFTYATFGFGQGFSMSPLQLVRAYTPLANEGKLIEPYLVGKIVDSKNNVYESDDINAPEAIRQKAQTPVLDSKTAEIVTNYLVKTVDEGYLGLESSKGRVPGYTVAGKTGTAQVARTYNGMPCGYTCNTERGIYDHTFIGYGPVSNPEVIILIKLSEPQPGVVKNFSGNTVGPGFSKMMGWTLDYMGVPKEPGR